MSAVQQNTQWMTAEELWEMPEAPDRRYELVDGELIEVPGATGLHALIVGQLFLLLQAFARDSDLGVAFPDGAAFILRRGPDHVRIPDVSFISWDRVPAEGVPGEGYMPVAPDLAVEIVSPGDQADDIHDKVRQYLESGVRLVWVLWPKTGTVSVHVPGGASRELGPEDELDGGQVLPGFRVRVSELFDVRRSRTT